MCQGGSGLTVLFSETAPACGLNFLSQEHCPVSSSGWWPWLCPGSTVVIILLLTEPADAGSWIFDSASKEASSTVYDLVCVITSTRKSIISLVGTVKLLTYALSFPGIFPSTMEELYKPLNLAHFQPAVLFCTWVEGMMDFP